MKDSRVSSSWGGSRPGAGRKRKADKLAELTTKVVRVPLEMAELIKSGKIEALLAVVEDWEQVLSEASKTSPRWHKARQMMVDIQDALGKGVE